MYKCGMVNAAYVTQCVVTSYRKAVPNLTCGIRRATEIFSTNLSAENRSPSIRIHYWRVEGRLFFLPRAIRTKRTQFFHVL